MGRKKKQGPGQKGGPKEPGQIPVQNPATGIFEWAKKKGKSKRINPVNA